MSATAILITREASLGPIQIRANSGSIREHSCEKKHASAAPAPADYPQAEPVVLDVPHSHAQPLLRANTHKEHLVPR